MTARAFPPPYRFPSRALFHPLADLWDDLDAIPAHPSYVVRCVDQTATTAEYLVNIAGLSECFQLPTATCVWMLRDRGLCRADPDAYCAPGWTHCTAQRPGERADTHTR
jgi:hypothetical protein